MPLPIRSIAKPVACRDKPRARQARMKTLFRKPSAASLPPSARSFRLTPSSPCQRSEPPARDRSRPGKPGFSRSSPPARRPRHAKGSRPSAGGGGERDRTVDLLLAKQALSQLSYTPGCQRPRCQERGDRSGSSHALSAVLRPWWAREDLNLRPHAYQARALTS